MPLIPALAERKTMAVYKMEVFLSRKKYETTVEEILDKKKTIPIHLYVQYKNDRQN